jgi:hypothetical protein
MRMREHILESAPGLSALLFVAFIFLAGSALPAAAEEPDAPRVQPSEEEPAIPIPEERKEEKTKGEKEFIPPEDRPREPSEEKGPRPELVPLDITTVLGIPTRISLAPLATGRNSLFHPLVHIPAFEGARTLGHKVWYVEAGYDFSTCKYNRIRGYPGLWLVFDGNMYHEAFLRVAHGLSEGLEARLLLTAGNLREGGADLVLADNSTAPTTYYVQPYDRRADIGDLVLGLKWNLTRTLWDRPVGDPETGMTLLVDVKIPLAQNPENFTSSGGVDFGLTLASSLYVGKFIHYPVVGHANLGIVYPTDERYFGKSVQLDPALVYGLGLSLKFAGWGVLIAQLQGNTSAFAGFWMLWTPVLTGHVGARWMIGHFFLETGVGFPLSETSSDFSFQVHLGFHFMGKKREEEVVP